MSEVNAFLSTWSYARVTFGEGSPQTGAQFDNSGTLRQLESTLERYPLDAEQRLKLATTVLDTPPTVEPAAPGWPVN
jgi:hypothetical protein